MRVLTCEMTEEQKQEFCSKHNLDRILLEDNCPCLKENGIAIFPKDQRDEQINLLMEHLTKMTNQLNALTIKVNSSIIE